MLLWIGFFLHICLTGLAGYDSVVLASLNAVRFIGAGDDKRLRGLPLQVSKTAKDTRDLGMCLWRGGHKVAACWLSTIL
jgi:hypothetical protein